MIFIKSYRPNDVLLDYKLALICGLLLILGLVMLSSSSLALSDRSFSDATHYLVRQTIYTGLGLLAAMMCYVFISIDMLQRKAKWLVLIGLVLLGAVLIPQIGKSVNGSRRWIDLGLFTLQVSELMKFFMIVYFANYIERHYTTIVDDLKRFFMPLLVIVPASALLLFEPDYGATAVIIAVIFGMLFLARVKIPYFLIIVLPVVGAMAIIATSSEYRWERIVSFFNPWQDPYGNGYQLIQSLISIGSGGWFGLGLGNSVQKLFYLPEAHTDFIFSIMAEELGFIGVLALVILFWAFLQRCFKIGKCAEEVGLISGAYIAYGIGIWFSVQAIMNMAVAMGLMPITGITLPLVSYGGSSLVVSLIAIGFLMRVHYETKTTVSKPQYYKVKRKRYGR